MRQYPYLSDAKSLLSEGFIWFHDLGVGYYPVNPNTAPYNADYFARYEQQANTAMGRALMKLRADFVQRYHRGAVCDVGIGSGAFINEMVKRGVPAVGYDLNPAGVAWLKRRGRLHDPYAMSVEVLTMWDVLEHIHNFSPILQQARHMVFVSLPIFRDAVHARGSKHFRTDEHVWYFTPAGLRRVMFEHGFECVEENREETHAGREDIGSFAFRRIARKLS